MEGKPCVCVWVCVGVCVTSCELQRRVILKVCDTMLRRQKNEEGLFSVFCPGVQGSAVMQFHYQKIIFFKFKIAQ